MTVDFSAVIERFNPHVRRQIPHIVLGLCLIAPFLGGGAFALIDLMQAIGRQELNLRLAAHPTASAFYSFHLHIIPNMALDLFGLTVGALIGTERAVNGFMILTVLLFYVVIQQLRQVSGARPSLAAGALSLFVIEALPLKYGFANYMFGTALMLFALVRLERHLQRPDPLFHWKQALFLAVIYLSSLFPVIIYALFVLGTLIEDQRMGRPKLLSRFVRDHAPSAILLIFLFFASKTDPNWGGSTFWSASAKLQALLSLVQTGNGPFDIGATVALALFGYLSSQIWALSIPRRYVPPLALVALGWIAMPFAITGVEFVDSRLSQAMAALVLGLARARPREPERLEEGWPRPLIALLCAAILLKSLAIGAVIQRRAALRQDVAVALAPLPDGARLLTIGEQSDEIRQIGPKLAWLMIGQRDLYLPSLFTNYFISFRQPVPAPSGMDLPGIDPVLPRLVCAGYSHVLVIGRETLPEGLPLALMAEQGRARLFAVRRGEKGGPQCP
jgi:hypothetical protein